MAAMTLLQLRNATRALVGDSVRYDPANGTTVLQGPTTWLDGEINDALNFAQNDYCMKKKSTLVTASVASGSNLPSTSFGGETIVSVSNTQGVPIDRSTVEFEDLMNPGWRLGSGGTPKRWVSEDGIFFMSPNCPGSLGTVLHLEIPVPMTSDSATPDPRISDAHNMALAYGASAHLLMQGRDQASAQKAGNLVGAYLGFIGAMA